MKFFKSAFEINWPLGTAVLKGWDFGSAFGILLHYLQAGGIKDKGIQLHKYVSSGDLLQSNNWKREVRWQNKKMFWFMNQNSSSMWFTSCKIFSLILLQLPYLKSVNLWYNMLVCWVAGTTVPPSDCPIFQQFLQNSSHNYFQCFYCFITF